MDIIEKLKEQGWYLTEEAIKKLPDDVDKSDSKKIIQTVMDMDLRGIADGALPSDISKKNDSILGRRVLQITKIRNLSAPKANEESKVAPRFLQIELTDGVNQIFALEIDNISSISLNTPPGTKLYLRSDRIPLMQGQLVLRSNDIQILGGKVQHLIEKWEMNRTLQKYSRSGNQMIIMSGSSGPPPWIAFGQKIQHNITGNNDKNFKSLSVGTGADKENKEKNEFDIMRSEAIAEATKAGSKKTFGGGNQQLLDHNLKKIMEKGFTEEEARNALKANRNILEQALYNLKRRDEFKNKDISGGKRGGFKDTKKSKIDEPIIATKPAANVSLFDFLTDKLPTNPETSDKNVSNKSDRPKSFNHDNSKPPSYHHSQQSYNHQHQTSNTHYQSAVNSHQQQSHHQQQKRDQHSQQQHQQQSQSQSQYHQMQQQQGNYNHASRQKFENNLSSSFATRNTSSSDQQQSHDNYKNRDKNPQENVQNINTYSSSRQKDSSEKYKNNQRSSNYGQNQRPNERYSGTGYQKSGGSSQQTTQQSSQHQSQSQHQHQLQSHNQQQSSQQSHQHQPQQQYSQDRQPQQQQSQYVKTTSSSGSYDSRNRNEYHKRNGYDTGKGSSSNSSRYNLKDSNSHQPTVRNYNENRQQHSNTNDNGKMNKLIEETSKIKIESSSTTSRTPQQQQSQQQQPQPQQQQPQPQHQNSRIQSNVVATSHHQIKPYQQHHQQQPPSQQGAPPHLQQRPPSHSQHQQMQPPSQSQQPQHNIPPHTTYTQLPNGFTYDPSKIMGFQSKEANDFAMTLLKSQAAAASAAIPPIQVTPHAAYPSPIQIPPPAFPTPQFVMPPTAAAPPQMAGPYSMTQCSGENWNWKTGDRCLAKYWDDGRYYEAEVTAVSAKTCVVLYLGYGNHEEVLKCDCLPITDAQHRPINMSKLHETHQPPPPPTAAALANAAAVAAVPPPTVASQAVISATTIPTPLQPQPQPPLPPASISQQHALNRGIHAANRYRGERQMYVPPPKRDG